MPDQVARQLANAPLVFVITAIRFESLEALPSWIADIQEELRERLPMYRRIRQQVTPQGFELAVEPNDFDPAQVGSAWSMSSVDFQTSAQFAKNVLTFSTKSYTTFDQFAEQLSSVLFALISRAKRIHVSQVGIRYVDHIRVIDGSGVEQFMPKELLPHQPEVDGLRFRSTASTTTYTCGDHFLNVRFSTGAGMPVMPDDLLPMHLATSKPTAGVFELAQMGANEGVLDTDCVAADLGPKVMTDVEIVELLRDLHTHANKYFRSVQTEQAKKAWEGVNQEMP